MFDEFISVLKTMEIQRERALIKAIPMHLLDEYNMVNIYKFLVLSKDFNDFENRYYKLRESAVWHKQDAIKDNMDVIYTLAMTFKDGD